MDIYTIAPGIRHGRVTIPSSKSLVHRLLICGALSDLQADRKLHGMPGSMARSMRPIIYTGESNDIRATKACLLALCSEEGSNANGELSMAGGELFMACGASGSTLRFLLPICGALGKAAVFHREGGLETRPMGPLIAQLQAHGMEIREEGADLYCSGTLRPGTFTIPGNISSQYISGLLMALPLLQGDSVLYVTGRLQSASYVTMTLETLALAGIEVQCVMGGYQVTGGQRFCLPEDCVVPGDWSNAAAFLCMGALSRQGIRVDGLAEDSQGDRAILDILHHMGAQIIVERTKQGDVYAETGSPSENYVGNRGGFPKLVSVLVKAPARGVLHGVGLDAGPVPDLIPVVSALAMHCQGTTHIYNGSRLRLKESDRLETTAALIRTLGGTAEVREDQLLIRGAGDGSACFANNENRPDSLRLVKTRGDHRIAMAAAVAACGCSLPVRIDDEQCTDKSYPDFWKDFDGLFTE